MARPLKIRRVFSNPKYFKFGSLESTSNEIIYMTVDEYECIRLIDYERYTQNECAKLMMISRPTVSAIYQDARIKISDALMNGKTIIISGGNYKVCSDERWPGRNLYKTTKVRRKEVNNMRIAVTYANGQIFQHFGKTEQFKIYDVNNNQEVVMSLLYANGVGHGALAELLAQHNVDVLICGGIGGGAINAIKTAGIQVCAGVSGNADQAVIMFVNGDLKLNDQSNCNHHNSEHHDESHQCHCGDNHEENHKCACGKH